MPVTSWSTTASDNATADSASGISWPEGMSPAQVNDSARAMMAVIKGDFAKSHAASGYQKFPNGLIIQWGLQASVDGSNQLVTFPVTFPTAIAGYSLTHNYAGIAATRLVSACLASTPSTSQMNIAYRYVDNGGGVGALASTVSWIAIGY